MKNASRLSALALATLVSLSGSAFAQVPAEACGSTTWPLTAGQTIPVGTMTVSNDMSNIYVNYHIDTAIQPDATFGTLHLWVGNSLLNLPTNPQGIPVPGQFCSAQGGSCYDATGLTDYTFTVPFSSISYVDATQACGQQVFVVPHAEVLGVDRDGDGTADGGETAWGGPNPGPGPRWWFYGTYTICCDFGTPNPGVCQTAYGKGNWVWTTDRKSNPERLPSLNLTRNRWGWAIQLAAPGVTTHTLWAGAGLNNTGNGAIAGTVTVDWDGTSATVTYTMASGYTLEEAHVYAGDAAPATIAPGQYGSTAGFDPNVPSYTVTLPLADVDGTAGVWIVAHAVACR